MTPSTGEKDLVERLGLLARIGGHGLENLLAEAAAEITRLRSQGGGVPEGYRLVPEFAIRWLLGEGPDANGNHFGDEYAYDFESGRYWWRSEFRALLSASPPPPTQTDLVQASAAVINAACQVVYADTYKHPMLSRADAVAAGVAALHDAVGRWEACQPAATDLKAASAALGQGRGTDNNG